MTSLGDAVVRIEKAVKAGTAPAEIKRIWNAVRSPVDLSCAIVEWCAALDDKEIAAFDAEITRCCRTCAQAVCDYRFHGLEKDASALLKRLPAPPKPKEDADA